VGRERESICRHGSGPHHPPPTHPPNLVLGYADQTAAITQGGVRPRAPPPPPPLSLSPPYLTPFRPFRTFLVYLFLSFCPHFPPPSATNHHPTTTMMHPNSWITKLCVYTHINIHAQSHMCVYVRNIVQVCIYDVYLHIYHML
jgi:hypothetical protein